MAAYAELAAASNFSFLHGASHPEEYAAAASVLGLDGFAVTDRNTVAGIVRAHAAIKKTGGRFAPGCRLVFRDGTPDVLAWPEDRDAYGRLCRLLTAGNRRAPKGECHLALPDVLEWGRGLVLAPLARAAGPGVGGGASRSADLVAAVTALREAFPGAVRLAVAPRFRGTDRRRILRHRALAEACGVPLLAVGDLLYHAPERRMLQDVVTCIREHVTLDAAGRLLEANAERHMKSPAMMARIFRDAPEAVAESVAVLERLTFSIADLRYDYPDEPTGDAASPQQALVRYTEAGAVWRYPDGVPEQVAAALAHELALIAQLGYAPYFLTVRDLVTFARGQGILCQGRGSAANSAVCFCLGITEVDPTKSDLLFERFVSANRNEPPDIDVDFEHERREEVIQYIYEKYGRHRAGLAATVISYRARSSVREVGKAFGFSEDAVSALSGMIWGWSEAALKTEDAKRAGLDPADPRVGDVLALAKSLIGFPRHLSQHVGGFVMTRGRLDESVPIQNAAMADRTVIEWDKDDLDAAGMMKVDVLALGMLTALAKAYALIRRHYGRDLSIAGTSAHDDNVFDMICRADTVGVFQIESRAQMSMLPRLRPRKFYDLVIEVAIVRPGPIQGDMVHPYLRRREGAEPVEYPSAELEGVLAKTLGVPLFQEQAMKIAIVAAGFTPEEADGLRRAMATFRHVGTIGTFRDKMIEGMVAKNYDRDFAERCFKQIEGFGSYGFPESHAASFALLVYASAWVKCYYPDVFAASLLNAQPMGFYAPAQLVRDAREHGVLVRPVDVNFSEWDNTLEPEGIAEDALVRRRVAAAAARRVIVPLRTRIGRDPVGTSAASFGGVVRPVALTLANDDQRFAAAPDGPVSSPAAGRLHPRHASMAPVVRATHAVRLGLRQVKGFAEAEARALEKARGAGFDSVRDLWLRTGLDRSTIERLADADAFRSLGLDRRAALWAARGLGRSGAADKLPLFAAAAAGDHLREPDVSLPPMPLGEHVVNDYRYLSLSLKAHPVAFIRGDLAQKRVLPNERLADTAAGRRVTVAGLVLVRQRPGSASGVIFMTLEDETGIANLVVWPKVFETFRPVVIGARLVRATGRLQKQKEVIHVVVDTIADETALLSRLAEEHHGVESFARADAVKHPGSETREKARGLSRAERDAEAARLEAAHRSALGSGPEPPTPGSGPATPGEAAKDVVTVMPKGRNFH